jgi:large subunit ribosomal protein L21
VRPEQTVRVDLLAADAGSTVEFREVLLIGDNGGTQVGNPLVDGARVIAEVLESGRDPKVLVFKYKNKTRYRRRRGHRQGFTRLTIRQILTAGEEPAAEDEAKKPPKPSRRRTAAKPESEVTPEAGEAETIVAETSVDEAAAEAKPKRAPRTRKAPAQAEASARAAATPKRQSRARKAAAETEASGEAAAESGGETEASAQAPKTARRPRTTKKESRE